MQHLPVDVVNAVLEFVPSSERASTVACLGATCTSLALSTPLLTATQREFLDMWKLCAQMRDVGGTQEEVWAKRVAIAKTRQRSGASNGIVVRTSQARTTRQVVISKKVDAGVAAGIAATVTMSVSRKNGARTTVEIVNSTGSKAVFKDYPFTSWMVLVDTPSMEDLRQFIHGLRHTALFDAHVPFVQHRENDVRVQLTHERYEELNAAGGYRLASSGAGEIREKGGQLWLDAFCRSTRAAMEAEAWTQKMHGLARQQGIDVETIDFMYIMPNGEPAFVCYA